MLRDLIPIVPVEDVTRSVEFYQKVLGFRLVSARGQAATRKAHIRCGSVELVFVDWKDDESDTPPEVDVPPLAMWHFSVVDVNALYERVRAAGAHIERPLTLNLFGGAEFSIRDVDGRVVYFSQYEPQDVPHAAPPDVAAG